MAFRLKRIHGPQWLSGGAHVLVLYGAAEAETPAVWPYALIAIAGISFFAWLAHHPGNLSVSRFDLEQSGL